MVKTVTNFGRNGVSDWLLQRVSAVVITVYFLFLVCWLAGHKNLDFATWQGLNQLMCMKIFNTLTLAALVIHSWIGIWAVLTDYITVRLLGSKATFLRLLLEIAAIGFLIVYALWGLAIVWGV